MKRIPVFLTSLFFVSGALALYLPARGAGHLFSDGKLKPSGQLSVREIRWEDWRTDTFGCMGKRWTYLDSIDRSDLNGLPRDTVIKYMGAPRRTEHYVTDTKVLHLFKRKYSIPYDLYPITSDCATKEPWVAVRVYYDRHGLVLGFSRQYPKVE